jgi:hypothetical protein
MNLSISDMLRAGQYREAVERMQTLLRADPAVPVDVDGIIRQYEASRAHLRSVVAPSPFRVVVEWMRR